MQQLNEAIATVLREVERGFAARRAAGGLPLTPERIRLTLNFSLDPTGQIARTEPDAPHSVTVEFKVGEWGQLQPVAAPAAALPKQSPVVGIVPVLTQVFGAPGFDSSARATVFREALAGKSHDEVLAVLATLRPDATAPLDDATRQASHVLRGIIQSGPLKNVGQGAKLLVELMTEHPLAEVLRVAETTWKTHDDWLGIKP
ncbi:MAG: hypothetical protein ACKODH_01000 [Limisphaerales bacterium]